jgi:rRNA processing protein Krr1/Pno1
VAKAPIEEDRLKELALVEVDLRDVLSHQGANRVRSRIVGCCGATTHRQPRMGGIVKPGA